MMDSAVHSSSCAFLICAEAFLSQGIEKLIKERHPDSQTLASEDVCRICCAVVNAQSKDLLLNLNTLLNRYECTTDDEFSRAFVKTEYEILQDKTIPSSVHFSFCQETIGKHGRSLVADHSVGRGQILLKESPYAAVKSTDCGCAVGNLLTEHITLAVTIRNSKPANAEKYGRFLSSFYSGLTSKESSVNTVAGQSGTSSGGAGVSAYKHRPSASTQSNNTGDEIIRDGSSTWPLRTQILMALVCAIRNIYTAHTQNTANYGTLTDYTNLTTSTSTNNTSTVRTTSHQKERLFYDTWALMRVLSRLPHNTHAISSVVSSQQGTGHGKSSREVQQVRLGYGVFLHASSINHSCRPNANIRYTTLPYQVSGDKNSGSGSGGAGGGSGVYGAIRGVRASERGAITTTADPTLQYLRNVQIEIVSTSSIPSHQLNPTECEVCVSYGPLQGVHNVVQRRSVLSEQYLFRCECAACVEDENSTKLARTNTTSPANTAYPDTNTATLQSVSPHAQSAIHHINALSQPKHDTTHLSTTITLLKQQLAEMNSLFTTVVHHVQSDPQNVPLLHSFESKKLIPVGDKITYLQSTYYPDDVKLADIVGYGVMGGESVYKSDALYVDYCSVYCTFLDIYAHIHALQSNYTTASRYINYAITLMISSGMYPSMDVVIGRERVKLGGVLLSAGNKKDCGVQVKCALEILIPVVSRDDPDVTEAKHMLAFCRS